MATRNTLNAGLSALALAILLGVAGCGSDDESGGGGDSSTSSPDGSTTVAPVAVPPNLVFESQVTGSVGDGPITGARMRVLASNGKVLMETESSLTADYDLTIKTQGRNYALTIEAEGGTDIVTQMQPDFRLVATLVKPNKRSIGNLNPFTTLIVGAAKSNGGINETTVAVARDAVVDRYGFGLDKNIIPDPTATPIDENTVHVIVKSSETLGEMIRRTRDALYASGGSLDGDGIVAALAADLSDGWIDGKGAAGHDPRVAAVANIASAAVLVQSMANRLYVYGYDATGAMDAAILQIRPLAPATSSTAHVAIPAETLDQAVRTLEAARVLSDDLRLVKLIEVVRSASPGALPADLAAGLAAETDPLLEELTVTAAYASDDQLARINNVASGGTDTPPETTEPPPAEEPPPEEEPAPPPEDRPRRRRSPPAPPPEEEPAPPPPNNPPVISGTPTASVLVGESWEFQPTASDPDGDSLSFSISNKPAWLSFDAATGRTWGTPVDANVGIHSFITITVSDGQASVSLDPFSVTVSAPPPPPCHRQRHGVMDPADRAHRRQRVDRPVGLQGVLRQGDDFDDQHRGRDRPDPDAPAHREPRCRHLVLRGHGLRQRELRERQVGDREQDDLVAFPGAVQRSTRTGSHAQVAKAACAFFRAGVFPVHRALQGKSARAEAQRGRGTEKKIDRQDDKAGSLVGASGLQGPYVGVMLLGHPSLHSLRANLRRTFFTGLFVEGIYAPAARRKRPFSPVARAQDPFSTQSVTRVTKPRRVPRAAPKRPT
jgi:hypothetical protein